MTTSSNQVHPAVRRFAVLTCCVALLPITVGALVTTLKAGMAFADWPTSDGQNMLLYPWLSDLRHTDKFVEHGHRLAGVLIGLVGIMLVVVAFVCEKKPWVRKMAVAILLAVIAQGLLGGMRVRMNEQILAMTHSITGGLFFTLTFLFAALTRTASQDESDSTESRLSLSGLALTTVLPALVLVQYVMGGMFRHLGRMLHEHLAGAIIVGTIGACVVWMLLRCQQTSLRRAARYIAAALLVQISLGMGSWVTKLGLPALGWVASVNSTSQNITCTLHTVGGMFLLATTSLAALTVIRLATRGRIQSLKDATSVALPSSGEGGIA